MLRMDEWTLPAVLRQRAAAHPDDPFLQFEQGDVISYGAFLKRVEAFAAGLRATGVAKGDRVLLLMDNSVEMIVAWFAANLLGAVEVPVNSALRGRFLEHVVNNSGARIAVVDAKYVKLLADVAPALANLRDLVCLGAPQSDVPWRIHPFETLPREPVGPAEEVSFSDTAAIMYTSGTTGPAKGVVMPHGHMYIFARHMTDALRIGRGDTYMVVLPLFHGNAQIVQVYSALIAGAKVQLYERFSASRWIEQIRDSGATVSSLLGVMAQFIFAQPPSPADRAHRLTRLLTIPMPAALAAGFEDRFGARCIDAYGMTEICLPLFRRFDEELRPGSCGRPFEDWFEVDIVDPATDEPVPPGGVGEIVVRPKYPWTMMAGYNDMPERTLEAWRNLWFHTGDAGTRDAEGYFYFVDRLQDRIRRRGENLSSYEIEAVACEHPAVIDAAAVAVPAEEGEDEIKLCIVTNGTALDYVEFIDHCKARMPYFAVPRYITTLPELPKTPNGKVLKRTLREPDETVPTWDRIAAGYHIGRDG